MNSDLDNNSDTLYNRLIAWLLQESVPAAPTIGRRAGATIPVPKGEPTAADFELDHLDWLDLEELNIALSYNDEAELKTAPGQVLNAIPADDDLEPGDVQSRSYNSGRNADRAKPFSGNIKTPTAS